MPDDEDFSETDTTAAEFDAMWNEAEPVEVDVPLAANLTVNYDGRLFVSEPRGTTVGTSVKVHTPDATLLEGETARSPVGSRSR
jgi:hypothetical protein